MLINVLSEIMVSPPDAARRAQIDPKIQNQKTLKSLGLHRLDGSGLVPIYTVPIQS